MGNRTVCTGRAQVSQIRVCFSYWLHVYFLNKSIIKLLGYSFVKQNKNKLYINKYFYLHVDISLISYTYCTFPILTPPEPCLRIYINIPRSFGISPLQQNTQSFEYRLLMLRNLIQFRPPVVQLRQTPALHLTPAEPSATPPSCSVCCVFPPR